MSQNYGDKLKEGLKQILATDPEIGKVLDIVRKYDRMSSMEFDYPIERTYLMYKEIQDLLNKKE